MTPGGGPSTIAAMRPHHLVTVLAIAFVLCTFGGCSLLGLRFGDSGLEQTWDERTRDGDLTPDDVDALAHARAQDLERPTFLVRAGTKAATGDWVGLLAELAGAGAALYGTHRYTKYRVHRERDEGRLAAGEPATIIPKLRVAQPRGGKAPPQTPS